VPQSRPFNSSAGLKFPGLIALQSGTTLGSVFRRFLFK
jgi:hypothetical protein